jgi:hypothetical protein
MKVLMSGLVVTLLLAVGCAAADANEAPIAGTEADSIGDESEDAQVQGVAFAFGPPGWVVGTTLTVVAVVYFVVQTSKGPVKQERTIYKYPTSQQDRIARDRPSGTGFGYSTLRAAKKAATTPEPNKYAELFCDVQSDDMQ